MNTWKKDVAVADGHVLGAKKAVLSFFNIAQYAGEVHGTTEIGFGKLDRARMLKALMNDKHARV